MAPCKFQRKVDRDNFETIVETNVNASQNVSDDADEKHKEAASKLDIAAFDLAGEVQDHSADWVRELTARRLLAMALRDTLPDSHYLKRILDAHEIITSYGTYDEEAECEAWINFRRLLAELEIEAVDYSREALGRLRDRMADA